MKRLFTSCFAFSRHLPKAAAQVQIARWAPDDWTVPNKMVVRGLAPDEATWKAGKQPGGNWRLHYELQLDGLRRAGTLDRMLEAIPEGAILLCWEHSDGNCHRATLADFLRRHRLADVTEYPVPPEVRRAAAEAARVARQTRRPARQDEPKNDGFLL